MNVLKVILVGKVGKDASMRYTPSGQPVTQFSVAVSRQYKKDDQQVKETTWMRVTVWGKLAENCNMYVKKGMEVYVEGRLTPDAQGNPRTYEKDGVTKASFEMVADIVQFGAKTEAQPKAEPVTASDPDEFPF